MKMLGVLDYLYGFCDKNYQEIQTIEDKRVYSYDDVKNLDMVFIICVADSTEYKKIEEKIKGDNNIVITREEMPIYTNVSRTEFNRVAYATSYIKCEYFDKAEETENLNIFWGEQSNFKRMFQELDLSNVIELACGHGRHVHQYVDLAGKVTLVDILMQNINYCKERFMDFNNIEYYCNNGYNLEKLESGKYTALFCYDAMIQFELLDICEYLKDIYRVLCSGGMALIHHSNFDSNYKATYKNNGNFGSRAFMSKNLFAHIAYMAGFEVKEQKVIDWFGKKDLDCITLLVKK